ncbi:hypothetical protein Tco_1148879, partial [Tanacetum coccineum]
DLKGKEIDNIGRLRRYRGLALTKDHSRKRSIGVSRWTLNAVFNHMESYNILEDIKRGPYSKKSPIRRKIDDPNITMEEYIKLKEEKARRRGKVFNWETATYGKIWDNKDVQDFRSLKLNSQL